MTEKTRSKNQRRCHILTFSQKGMLRMKKYSYNMAWLKAYGWNSPRWESLLDKCHQNVCTLLLLTRSVLIEIACFFCIWSEL